MRAPSEIDMRDAMLAQMVDAFMVADDARYLEAIAWLCDYCDEVQTGSGRKRIGNRWYDPERYAIWCETLKNNRRGCR
jgi:hypothetical protein